MEVDARSRTALHLAVESRNNEVMEILMKVYVSCSINIFKLFFLSSYEHASKTCINESNT